MTTSRRLAVACLAVLFAAALLRAEVVRGEVKKVDADKGTLTVSVQGKEETFTLTDKTKITVRVASATIEPKDGLKNNWFRAAERDHGNGAYSVEVTVEQKAVTKVHLNTPTRRFGEDD